MSWFDRISRAALRSSVLWGALASVGFYAAVHQWEQAFNPVLLRFVAGRWEAYLCVGMFLIGLASLVIKAVDLVLDYLALGREILTAPAGGEQTTSTVKVLVSQLSAQPGIWQRTQFVRRLSDALEFVLRKGTNDELPEHLRYLADMDMTRMNNSYAVPRFLVWSIPAVGSLGTVLGIASAVAQLSAQPATGDAIGGVTDGLAIAFEVTALSLALSTMLMFFKFVCEHQESQLLATVEDRAQRELFERIGRLAAPRSNHTEQLRIAAEKLMAASSNFSQQVGGFQRIDNPAGSADQLENIVSRAVAKAVAGHSAGSMPGIGGEELTGLTQVQQALQQIATFFQQQQAEHLQENEVFKQLSDMIRDSSANWSTPRTPHSRKEEKDGSIASLWESLRD